MVNLVFIGPQGSGKGTAAKIISKKLGIPHISTGDLLRGLTGELRKQLDKHMNQGELVPDGLMLKILEERIKKPDCKKGFILDGYPRNLNQAKHLDSIAKIDKIVEISVSDKKAVERISSRLSCRSCGAVFNLITNAPEEHGICDYCGMRLYQREDDRPESIKKRLKIYHQETEPILNNYPSIKIDGEGDIETVAKDILAKIKG